ncbi:MAG: NTP transferase domain-containing protein [Vicinamibacterales bacterium]
MSAIVRDAVILAAGNGDRFKNGDHHSKLLHPVGGQPLILRTIQTAAAAGIRSFCVVVGFEADRVKAAVEKNLVPGTTIRFVYNPDWHLENGVSALAARQHCGNRRFALLMGDHLFEPSVLARMLALHLDPNVSVLAVDSHAADPAVIAEATRVRMSAGRITAIGKDLDPWDALDTGLFVFSPSLFDALEHARAAGETTLSAGVQRLAASGLMQGADVGGATWCDVDTIEDLDAAEGLLGVEPEPA